MGDKYKVKRKKNGKKPTTFTGRDFFEALKAASKPKKMKFEKKRSEKGKSKTSK